MTENRLQNPFVIQCDQCSAILGDSFALLNFKHNFLILNNVSDAVIIDKNKKMSNNGFDSDCTHCELVCKCKQIIGKFYYTVNKECGSFVDKYCLNRAACKSYTLGNVEGGKEIGLTDLCDEVEKLQRFCVYLHKKLEK